jgi:hypothetical protein
MFSAEMTNASFAERTNKRLSFRRAGSAGANFRTSAERDRNGKTVMRSYSPEFVQVMRAALDQVMTQIPLERATPSITAHMAEIILKAAAAGESTHDGLIAAASQQIDVVLSVLA